MAILAAEAFVREVVESILKDEYAMAEVSRLYF
jgi:hypothetical protein